MGELTRARRNSLIHSFHTLHEKHNDREVIDATLLAIAGEKFTANEEDQQVLQTISKICKEAGTDEKQQSQVMQIYHQVFEGGAFAQVEKLKNQFVSNEDLSTLFGDEKIPIDELIDDVVQFCDKNEEIVRKLIAEGGSLQEIILLDEAILKFIENNVEAITKLLNLGVDFTTITQLSSEQRVYLTENFDKIIMPDAQAFKDFMELDAPSKKIVTDNMIHAVTLLAEPGFKIKDVVVIYSFKDKNKKSLILEHAEKVSQLLQFGAGIKSAANLLIQPNGIDKLEEILSCVEKVIDMGFKADQVIQMQPIVREVLLKNPEPFAEMKKMKSFSNAVFLTQEDSLAKRIENVLNSIDIFKQLSGIVDLKSLIHSTIDFKTKKLNTLLNDDDFLKKSVPDKGVRKFINENKIYNLAGILKAGDQHEEIAGSTLNTILSLSEDQRNPVLQNHEKVINLLKAGVTFKEILEDDWILKNADNVIHLRNADVTLKDISDIEVSSTRDLILTYTDNVLELMKAKVSFQDILKIRPALRDLVIINGANVVKLIEAEFDLNTILSLSEKKRWIIKYGDLIAELLNAKVDSKVIFNCESGQEIEQLYQKHLS